MEFVNPLFEGWYADPEIHFFRDRYYIYPTFSAKYEEQTFFEVFSSPDLKSWRSEGKALDFETVSWSTNRAAWAPSIAEKGGRYYMYFSAGDGAGIGVAVSDHPAGPFSDPLGKALISEYHHGAQPIDAHAFIDPDDGRSFLFYGGWRHAVVVELGSDMVSTKGEFFEITPENYVEGPFMLKRNGEYYFMWSEGSWGDASYGVAYGRAGNPLGPFTREGVVLQSDPRVATSAGHHSVIQLPNSDEYLICYHRRPLDRTDRDHRVVCLDRLQFNADGSILPVRMT